jgi:fatty acid desaturase
MIDSIRMTGRRGLHPVVAVACALMVAFLVVPTALIAIALGLGLAPLPYDLLLVLQRLPIVFSMHMIASGLALILIPITAFARHRRKTHRMLGRVTAACVVVGGLTALPVALASEAVAAARAGLFAQGLVWLALITTAVAAIRRGDAARHAALMVAMAAVASGAVWLRLVMAIAAACQLPFEVTYGVAAWACWLVPLAVTQAHLLTNRSNVDQLARRIAA